MVHILKGTWFYRMFIALVLYLHILADRGRAMSLIELGRGYITVKTACKYVKRFRRYGDSNFYVLRHLAAKPEMGVAK